MKRLCRSHFTVPLFTSAFFILTGCAARNVGYGPHFPQVDDRIRTIAVLTPEFSTYNISGGGIPEYRVDWSRKGKENLVRALLTELENHHFKGIDAAGDTLAFNADTVTTFIKHVSNTILRHTFGQQAFIPQIDSFSYSTGSLATLCDYYESDAVLFLFGMDEHFSDLYKSTMKKEAAVKTAKSAVFATVSLILLGSGTYRTYSVPPERSFLCCLVADRKGRILWFNRYLKADDADTRTASDAEKLAKAIVAGLYPRKKP
jgi:hypothetical protein